MTQSGPGGLDRLVELLATRAAEGLSAPEIAELEALSRAHPEVDVSAFDRVAGRVWMAGPEPTSAMPAGLRDRIVSASASARGATSGVSGMIAGGGRSDAATLEIRVARLRSLAVMGWLAAAAAVLLAVGAWVALLRSGAVPGGGVVRGEVGAAALRERLIAEAKDVRTVALSATKDPLSAGLSGDVVWSPSRGEGYVRLRGLAGNEPSKNQYQLWVFDGGRSAEQPIGAGVFDVSSTGGEVVVPLKPGLRVFDAKAFALSLELPGGAVLPNMDRVLALAK